MTFVYQTAGIFRFVSPVSEKCARIHLMRQQYLLSICVFLLAVIGLSATDALAQFSVFGGRGGRPGGGVGGARGIEPPLQGSGSRNERRITAPEADSYEQIEYRLSTLHDELKLTPAQDMAWQSFATKTRAWAADIARERARNMCSSSSVAGTRKIAS